MPRKRLSIALFILSLALCRIARAQDQPQPPADDKRPTTALAACASGDVTRGVAILGELYAETRNPSFVFNQGRCYQKNGQLEQARFRFDEYLRIGTSEPPEDIQRAQGLIKEIDEALARQRASAPAPVVTAPAGPTASGSTRALRIASVVLAGVGVVAVGTGVVMSFKVKSINDEINQDFATQGYVTDVARLERQIADGQRYEMWQWVGYGVGAAALAGAVTTFILGGKVMPWSGTTEKVALDVTPSVSPSGMGGVLRLRF